MKLQIVPAMYAWSSNSLNSGLVHLWKCNDASGDLVDSVGSLSLSDSASPGYSQDGLANLGNSILCEGGCFYARQDFYRAAVTCTFNLWYYNTTTPGGLFCVTDFASGTPETEQESGVYISASKWGYRGFPNEGSMTYAYEDLCTETVSPSAFWQMYTMKQTVSNNTLTIYRNATSVGTYSSARLYGETSTGVYNYFGRSGIGNVYAGGRIQQIAYWNRALSAAEITSLYNSGNGLAYPW